ncbi:MAG: amylo-alpha-1,6-glucosidase [Candidatus Dormibacteraeota bacterium]|uniref:Amylo-alpha-1,6-glucosidase n=1 Tax=Candidatus Aeolococcus gillhamiae TaxID=3127015 RepID=A0A934JUW0_9BACT|nr:amylo-alpha-1,6-glucosidase [Candidatus Dormibacteraeota bacterium]
MTPDPTTDRRRLSRTSLVTVQRGPALMAINQGSTFLVCATDSSIESLKGQGQGLYADDTRFLSRHRLRLNGQALSVVASSRLSYHHARWTLMASEVASLDGNVSDVRVIVTVDRVIGAQRLHEDLAVTAYGATPVLLLLEVILSSDFADLFEVRTERWQRRASLATTWHAQQLESRYRRDGFVRRCLVRSDSAHPATYANGELHFPIDLQPNQPWRAHLQYDLLTSARARPALASCPVHTPVEDRAERLRRRWHRTVSRVIPTDLRMLQAYEQAVEDFAALRLYDLDFSQDVWLPAAGIPWFVAVFGRDSLLASMQALPVHPLFAMGTLQKLSQWQATEDDPVRDAEPGKICHEMRVGEWAQFHTIPHSPYYGTADATPLYLLLLAETYRWLGDAEPLGRFRDTAERCLDWIDRYGDRDGDGLQEWAPRSATGYRNQCWRDAEDGVLDEQGGFPPHPIGTCELQAYVYAAKRGIADLFAAWGDGARAQRLRDEAELLRGRFLEAYWLEVEGTVAFALDGNKRALRTATSNPGQVLWLSLLDQDRGERVANRLMQADLFSGWGLRTLSTEHPSYDPYSYQRGSIWPHDTMIAAAGLRRYGRIEDAWRLVDGLLAAVTSFERIQMPELFCGLPRRHPGVPVPYQRANVPQAWAAGSIFMAVRVLLGLEPDAPHGRIYLDPALPPWCPELTIRNVRVGAHRLAIRAWRRPDGSCEVSVEGNRAGLEVVRGRPPWLELPLA